MRKEVFDSVQQVRIVKTGLPFLLHRIVNQRSAEHDTKTSLESRSSFVEAARILRVDEYEALPGHAKSRDVEYWERFEAIRKQAKELAFDSARERVRILDETHKTGLPLGAVSGIQVRGNLSLSQALREDRDFCFAELTYRAPGSSWTAAKLQVVASMNRTPRR